MQPRSSIQLVMQPQAYIFDLDGLILDTGGCNSSLTVEGQLIAMADVEVLPMQQYRTVAAAHCV